MNKYNVYYFFKNMNKKLNKNSVDIQSESECIYKFMQEDRSYQYLDSFKSLEDIVNIQRHLNKIDKDIILEYVNKLIADIEAEDSNEFKDYSYIEEKIRNIVFSIK